MSFDIQEITRAWIDSFSHKLLPKFNSLNIFDVVNIKDMHFVSEITDPDYKRYFQENIMLVHC